MTQSSHEIAVELDHIRMQMEELLGQAEALLPSTEDSAVRVRAEAYWISHMKSAIGGHGYNSMCSMTDTITELEEGGEDEDG